MPASIFKYALLAALVYFPLFGHLDALPLRIWDESRLAINAYEMLKSGELIVTRFDGEPDMWNTKPPLMIWLQAACMKLLGVHERAVRLPSACAAALTALALLIFSRRYMNGFWFGFITVMVLVSSQGYVHVHASRTGDYDSLLTLFTTASALLFFAYVETGKYRHLHLFFVALTLAVLTKGVSGLMFVPALLVYGILRHAISRMLGTRHLYIGLCYFLFVTLGYYFTREHLNPGYMAAVMRNEWGGRYLGTIEGHSHGFWYYLSNFIDFRLWGWYLFVPGGFAAGLLSRNNKIFRLSLFLSLLIISYFLLISASRTKLEWYDVPLYPFLSLVIAIFILFIFDALKKNAWLNEHLRFNFLPYLLLAAILIAPYHHIIRKTHVPYEFGEDREFYEIGYYLKGAVEGRHDVDGTYLLYEGYNPQNMFYIKILNDRKEDISYGDRETLSPRDVVIACQADVTDYLGEHYDLELLEEAGTVKKFRILNEKD